MLKKFFLAVLVIEIIFCSQLTNFEKAEAKDVFAYSEGGIEYYISGHRTLNPLIGAFGSVVKGVSGGKIVKTLYFVFNPKNEVWLYQIQDWTGGMARSYVMEQGYLSNSGKAQTVYNVTKNNLNTIYQSDEKQEKIRKQQEEEKQRNLKEQEEKAEPLLEKAFEYFKKNQYDKVIELQKQAIEVAPDYFASYEELSIMYSRLNKHQLAINLLTNALSNQNLEKAKIFFVRGQIFENMRNISEAGKDYREALNHNPKPELRNEIEKARQRVWRRSI